MDNNFFKKPSFIALSLAMISFLAIDYVTIGAGFFSAGVTGIYLAKSFHGLSVLLWLIPLSLGYLGFAGAKPDHEMAKPDYVKIAKIVLLATSAFYVVYFLFIESVGSPGLGLWFTLLAAIFIQFEDQIMAQVNKKK